MRSFASTPLPPPPPVSEHRNEPLIEDFTRERLNPWTITPPPPKKKKHKTWKYMRINWIECRRGGGMKESRYVTIPLIWLKIFFFVFLCLTLQFDDLKRKNEAGNPAGDPIYRWETLDCWLRVARDYTVHGDVKSGGGGGVSLFQRPSMSSDKSLMSAANRGSEIVIFEDALRSLLRISYSCVLLVLLILIRPTFVALTTSVLQNKRPNNTPITGAQNPLKNDYQRASNSKYSVHVLYVPHNLRVDTYR